MEKHPDASLSTLSICSRHFKGGAPCPWQLTQHEDWEPSLHLHQRPIIRSSKLVGTFCFNSKPKPAKKHPGFLLSKPNSSAESLLEPTAANSASPNPPKSNLLECTERSLSLSPSTTEDQLSTFGQHDNTLSELFVDGGIDRSQIGRQVVIDRVINGVRQSFMLRLVDGAVDPPAATNGSSPAASSTNQTESSGSSSSSTRKRRRLPNTSDVDPTPAKQYSYVERVLRKLSPRFNMRPKQQSFKNLVLTYRTQQKRAQKKEAMIALRKERRKQKQQLKEADVICID